MIPRLKLTRSNDPAVDQLQDHVREVLDRIGLSKILDGVLVAGVVMASGKDTTITHGLGRIPYGYLPCSLSAAGIITLSTSVNPSPSTQLILVASAGLTASFWVF